MDVTGATSISISGLGVESNSSVSISPVSTTTYVLTASGLGGATTAQTTITVNPVTPPPPTGVVIFSVSPNPASVGQLITLTGSNFTATAILWITSPTRSVQGLRVTSSNGTTITFVASVGSFSSGVNTFYVSGSNGNSNSSSITIQ